MFFVRFAFGFFMVVDSSITIILFGWLIKNLLHSSKPFFVDKASTFIKKNFNVFFDMDYEYIQDNRAPMSDVVFINGEDL